MTPRSDDQGALSPDGALVYVQRRGSGTATSWLCDLAAKKHRSPDQRTAGNFRPAWSPDRSLDRLHLGSRHHSGPVPRTVGSPPVNGIYVFTRMAAACDESRKPAGVAGSPSWSSDGKQFLFYETTRPAPIWRNRAIQNGTGLHQCTTGDRTQYTASNQVKLRPKWLTGGRISYAVRGGPLKASSYGTRRHIVSLVNGQ